jgi:enamine deaminase RidA (YjgF/YER057c/UK114 family)
VTDRRRVSTDSRWESRFGYSRAVVVGDRCIVSGTTDPTHDHLDNAAEQARAALSTIEKALLGAGFSMVDVVRTRMYVTDPSDAEAVASVHGQVFGDVRPASTLVVVSALIEPQLRVEIEAEAVRSTQ